jgi:TRAP-type C4-dicarboxylate transport system substrate-binding protein
MIISTSIPKILRLSVIIGLFTVLLVAATGRPALSADQYQARLSYHWFPKHHAAIYANKFASEVEKATNGRLKIEIFDSGQLFNIRQALTAVSSGSVQMAGVLDLNFAAVDKNFMISLLGYFWPDYDKLHDFYHDTPQGKARLEEIQKKLGVKILCYDPVGPSALFSTKPLKGTVEELRGRKSRYLTAAEKPALAALGISMVSVGTSEMYTALKQGMIDTYTTNPSALKAYSWWDFTKYASLPYVSFVDAWIVANANWFNSLPADIQKTIMEDVGPRVGREATDDVVKYSNEILEEFKTQHGGTVVTIKGEEMVKLREIYRTQVWPVLGKQMDEQFYQAAKDYMGYK